MRCLIVVVLLFVGCFSPPPPKPVRVYVRPIPKRPQDMTDRILMDEKYPKWLKENYAQWIRYAYDLEYPNH